ncbi:MAG: hypothetical protein HYY04_12545 [Chloroflexi bacterium]|nr:hypothetical protein [Chloroflexota bacterium]
MVQRLNLSSLVPSGKATTTRLSTLPFTVGSELSSLSGRTFEALPLGRSDQADRTSELFTHLDGARRRLWLVRTFLILFRTVVLAAGVLLAITLLRLAGVGIASTAELAAVGVVGAWGLFLIANQQVRYFDVARLADRELGLEAQLGTAVELIQQHGWGRFVRPQVQAATIRARSLQAGDTVPFRFPLRDLRALGAIGAALALLTLLASLGIAQLPNADSRAASGADDAYDELMDPSGTWSDLDAANLLGLEAELRTNSGMQSVIEELNDLLRTKQISPEEYAARRAEIEEELKRRADESARAQAALGELADTLRDASVTREVADALNRGDYARASQALVDIAKQADKISPQGRQELAEKLREAAERTQNLNPEMSQRAAEAASALERGDLEAAQQAMQEMAGAISQASQQIASQADLGQALSELSPYESGEGFDENGALQENGEEGMGSPEAGAPSNGDPNAGEQRSGGGADTAQSRTNPGGGAGTGRGRVSGGSENTRALGVDGAGPPLRIKGKPTTAGVGERAEGPDNTPRTTSSEGTLSITTQSGVARSSAPINAYGEPNHVPIELRPVVKEFFSAGESRP